MKTTVSYKSLIVVLLFASFFASKAVFAEDRVLEAALMEKASGGMSTETKTIMESALAELRKSGIEKTAAGVGTKMPRFSLLNAIGKKVDSETILEKGPMILTFYRGGWCPYCNLQLHFYQKFLPEFKKKGATLVAVSPETPSNALSTKEKGHLEFEVLTDKDNKFASKLGLVYRLPEALKNLYKQFGIDLKENQANPDWKLPLSATYVVDKEGVIRWAFINADYKKRAEPIDILKVLENM